MTSFRDVTATRRPRSLSAQFALGVSLCAFAVAGCTPTISVQAGDQATEPVCADVVLALPDTVLDLPKVKTNAQATAAWGDVGAAVTFTCGVEPPAPTSEDCQSITASIYGTEETFDWIMISDDSGVSFVSYGREPAMMVQVPHSVGTPQPTAALLDVARAVSKIPATHACL